MRKYVQFVMEKEQYQQKTVLVLLELVMDVMEEAG